MSAPRKPVCPECGGDNIAEFAATRVAYPLIGINEKGEAETGVGRTASDGEFDGFECEDCIFHSPNVEDFDPAA